MINSQEIIERSIYCALLNTAVALKYSLNPDDFYPISIQNQEKFKKARSNLKKFIAIFGAGNAQSKDQKETPRIVVNPRGFYPGSIGLPKLLIEKQEGIGFTATEEPYQSLDQFIDIHLVANNQEDLRLLHDIMFWSIPQRGYIKPYNEDKFLFSGNIFINLVNFFDMPNLEMGIMEKIYQFEIQDCLIKEVDSDIDIVPIKSISLLLEEYGREITTIDVP